MDWVELSSSPREIPEESEAEAQGTDFPQSGQKRPEGYGESQDLYDRMACLLRNREYEEHNVGVERMASKTAPDVYLETVEEAEDQSTKPY